MQQRNQYDNQDREELIIDIPTSSSTISRRRSSPTHSEPSRMLPHPHGHGRSRSRRSGLAFGLPRNLAVGKRRWVVLGLMVGVVIWWWSRGKETTTKKSKERLLSRWWEGNTTAQALLAPRPSILSRPLPPPLLPSTHSLSQLQRLSSSFNPSKPPTWTALIHLTTTTQSAHLSSLLSSILKQSLPPRKVVLLSKKGLEVDTKALDKRTVRLVSYDGNIDGDWLMRVKEVDWIRENEFVLLVDTELEKLHATYARILLRASGTKEYQSAVLSSGGLLLPASCEISSDKSSKVAKETLQITIPTTPYLLKSTWITSLSLPSSSPSSFNAAQEITIAISLALHKSNGIPSFALPIDNENGGKRDWSCEHLKKYLSENRGRERELGVGFERGRMGGSGLRGRAKASEKEEEDGTTVFLLSGREELDVWQGIICDLSRDNKVQVYITDFDSPSSFSATTCTIPLTTLPSSTLQTSLIKSLESTSNMHIVFYTWAGPRASEFTEVLRWGDSEMSEKRGGGGAKRLGGERGTTVIALEKDEVVLGEWIGRLPVEALRSWHVPRIDISVITNNRPTSLARLLTSLDNAYYYGDSVQLSLNLEQTADKLTHRLVEAFHWSFGTIVLRHRIVLGGLIPAIVESWYPASKDAYGVFLEDDVEVSPLFYSWLKFTVLYYRYYSPMKEQSRRMFGVSLYQMKNLELRPEGRMPFDAHRLFKGLSLEEDLPYLSQIPCSWGAVYFPEIWKEFHEYLSLRLSELALPISEIVVPDIRSNKWARSWKKYFIELVYLRGYVMLYPNYKDFESFSTNHQEKGDHIKVAEVDKNVKAQFRVPLMGTNGTLVALPEGRLPDWSIMPIIDFWGSISTDEEIIERGWQTVVNLDTCEKPPRLDKMPTYDARELLCRREYERALGLVEANPLDLGMGEIAGIEKEVTNAPDLVEHPDKVVGGVVERGAEGEEEHERGHGHGQDMLKEELEERLRGARRGNHRGAVEAVDFDDLVQEGEGEEVERVREVKDVPQGKLGEELN